MAQREVVWRPQPGPQMALLTCPVFEVFFGGARGGGKTDGVLGEWIGHAGRYGEHANGLMVRRMRVELVDTIRRSMEIYGRLGWTWKEQDKTWIATNGARLRMAYLERDADAMLYQGHAHTRVYVEEVGNFPNPAPIMKLMATLRSAAGVPCGMRATGNPGGPGHAWVKARYIDPAPQGYRVITDPVTGLQRVYIPSRLADNRMLSANDPNYSSRLKASGSEAVVRAWLDGDWTVVAGAFFSEWSERLILPADWSPPAAWTRFGSFDWGSAKPFSYGLWAIADDDHYVKTKAGERRIPRGAIVRYREWYGAKPGEINVGLKLFAEQVADGILQLERREPKIAYRVADPACWKEDGGPSVAERMYNYRAPWDKQTPPRLLQFREADNSRIPGWDQMRARMRGERLGGGDSLEFSDPLIYVTANCVDSIRLVPAGQHDPTRPEDVDTDGEDHALDDWRYACMSRPLSLVPKPRPAPAHPLSVAAIFGDTKR